MYGNPDLGLIQQLLGHLKNRYRIGESRCEHTSKRYGPPSIERVVSARGSTNMPREFSYTTKTAFRLSPVGRIGLASASRGGDILYIQRSDAMLMKSVLLAKCFPTHIRRPNPNDTWPSSVLVSRSHCGLKFPCSSKYRSGTNSLAFSPYVSGSRFIPLYNFQLI